MNQDGRGQAPALGRNATLRIILHLPETPVKLQGKRDAVPRSTASIFVSTGELSGEMHAAHLIDALQRLRGEMGLEPARVGANGSARLKASGAILLHDVATWSELGIVHNLLKAQHFHDVITRTARFILRTQPDMVVLVDNRVLNLNLAKMLRNGGYKGKIVYYVAPVRWESLYDPNELERSLKNSRFLDQKRTCDLSILIYPVSLETYERLGINYAYIGHPLCELAKPKLTDSEFSALTGIELQPGGISGAAAHETRRPIIIGALPGSRVREVEWIAPSMYKALRLIQEGWSEDRQEGGIPESSAPLPPLHVVTPVAHKELRAGVLKAARQAGLEGLTLIDPEHTYDLMARADVMLVKSGTGLHECALMGVPAAMCYRVPAYLAWILRHVQKFSMPFYSFPNLLAGRAIVPELIQEDCNPLRIAETLGSLLFEDSERDAMLGAFDKLRESICKPEPLRTGARLLQDLLPA